MSSTLSNAIVLLLNLHLSPFAVDPPNPDRLSDLPDSRHAPLSSTVDFSSAMDVSEAVVMDLNNAIGTVLLASSPIVVPPAPSSTLSYKDTLLASGSAGSQPAVDTIDDEEVILLEGNVARSNVEGVISIQFSEHVQVLVIKNLEMTIVIKLLGRRIGDHTLRTKLYDLWKSSQAFRLMDIENYYFFATFRNRSD
ncbi:hypothetical protein GQ457_05G015760 [Hibiscus cannabinus]